MILCSYGCGREAKIQLKNRKWCCGENWQSCPITREKQRKSMKEVFHTEEWNRKISNRKKGKKTKPHKEEQRRK